MTVTARANNAAGASGNTNQTTGTFNCQTGDIIIVGATWEDAARTPTVSDTIGNTFTALTRRNNGTSVYGQIWYVLSSTGSNASNQITVNLGSFTSVTRAFGASYSYTGTMSQDGENYGTASSTTVTPTGVTTTGNGVCFELLASYSSGTTWTIASPFTELNDVNTGGSGCSSNDYINVSGSESIGSQGTCSTSSTLLAVTAAFYENTGGGGGATPHSPFGLPFMGPLGHSIG